MKKQYLIACFLVASNIAVQAQTAWDLRKCIEHALTHNLSIKQKEASRDQSAVELNTAQWKRLPNLNGNIGQSFNYGRAIQADNTYGNRNTRNTNFSIGTSIPLFTGMQIPNNIALSRLNLKAAIEDSPAPRRPAPAMLPVPSQPQWCWPRQVQSSIRVAKESWGLLSSDSRANRPHLGLCPEANVPLQGRQGSRGCIPDAPGETGIHLEGKQRTPLCSRVATGISWSSLGNICTKRK